MYCCVWGAPVLVTVIVAVMGVMDSAVGPTFPPVPVFPPVPPPPSIDGVPPLPVGAAAGLNPQPTAAEAAVNANATRRLCRKWSVRIWGPRISTLTGNTIPGGTQTDQGRVSFGQVERLIGGGVPRMDGFLPPGRGFG